MFFDSYSDAMTTNKDKSGLVNLLETRRSERHKKPSTRWTEESGYLAHPLRSIKKKVMGSNTHLLEETNFTPL